MERLTYTKKEAAKAIGVNVNAINSLIKSGQLKTMQIGNKVIIAKKALESLLENDIKIPSSYKKMTDEVKQRLREYKKK